MKNFIELISAHIWMLFALELILGAAAGFFYAKRKKAIGLGIIITWIVLDTLLMAHLKLYGVITNSTPFILTFAVGCLLTGFYVISLKPKN